MTEENIFSLLFSESLARNPQESKINFDVAY